MTRSRRWSVLAGLTAMLAIVVLGAKPPAARSADKPAEQIWLRDLSLTVSPAPAPVPALKYLLFPSIVERKDGNAVPIYLRLAHERTDAGRNQLSENPSKWNKLPLDQIPMKEAQAFVDSYKRMYRQFDLGARRKNADWSYTLDQGSVIDILLPDAQQMRTYIPMLVLKARVEIAERNYAAAIRTFETGFSFGQQVSEGPFLINGLIGIAIANNFVDALPDLMQCPDAPNLYWALTALPRPLIDMRKGMDLERQVVELQFPELADASCPRTPEQWDSVLVRFRKEAQRMAENSSPRAKPSLAGSAPDDPASRSPDLPAAKKYLVDVLQFKPAEVDAMPPARVLIVWIDAYAKEVFDNFFKATYLPYPQGLISTYAVDKQIKFAADTEAHRLTRSLLPAIFNVSVAQMRIQRLIDALRVIEALKIYAANHGGELPDRLDQITEAPPPDDPGTGKPFEYLRDGRTATLIGVIPNDVPLRSSLRYKVTLRK
jgi:hypothetical protein